MKGLGQVGRQAYERDQGRCSACGLGVSAVLSLHHVVPVWLGGTNRPSNLTVLCANCHRLVHWLASGDRALQTNGFVVAGPKKTRLAVTKLARQIRDARLKRVGPGGVHLGSVSLADALAALARRHGYDRDLTRNLKTTVRRALAALPVAHKKELSFKLVRGALYLSLNARNLLVLRVPAYSDRREPLEGDLEVIWPQTHRPSFMSARRFRALSANRFASIAYFNLCLTFEEVLSFSKQDWQHFASGVEAALGSRTRRWSSNVIPPKF